MPSTRTFAALISGTFLAFGILLANPAAAGNEVLINNYLPPPHPFQTEIVVPWIEDVTRVTGGAVVPKLSASAIAPPPQNWQTVTRGVADVVLMANLFAPKQIQLPMIAEIPLNSGSSAKTSMALWAAHEKYFAAANEYDGAVLLGSFSLTPSVIHSASGPITSLDDLKGYRLRASPGIAANLLRQLGAEPVVSGPSQIFDLVSSGKVDGVAVPAHGLPAFRIQPYIRAATTFPGGLSNTSFSLLMNRYKWESLTAEQQEQVMRVSGRYISAKGPGMDRIADGALEKLKDDGGLVVEAEANVIAVIRKFAEQLEADWIATANAKGIDGRAAFAYFRNQLK